MSDDESSRSGPVEAFAFPTSLSAHVVEPSERPRIHGYDVQGDLARSYSFAETVLIALTGEAPSRAVGRAFEAAMTFLSPVPVSEAPAHAALLARLCGASDAAVVSTGALTAAERAAWMVREHAAWLASLANVALPLAGRAEGAISRAPGREDVERLLEAAGLDEAPWPEGCEPTLDAAILAVLHACGLRTASALTAAITIATIATSAAEAFAVQPASFRDYPMDLPRFEYQGESDE